MRDERKRYKFAIKTEAKWLLVPPAARFLITYNNIEHHVHVANFVEIQMWEGGGKTRTMM